MKIIQLTAENIKRLVAVEIRPDGNLVQIAGKNGQGKTSVMDSIWWALSGAKNIQSAPIRKGSNTARIKLDMGEIVVTRTFKREKDSETGFTTKLEVAGKVKGSPQSMLDSLLDSLAFDPLKFARMDAKDQFNELRKYIPGVDFDQIAAENSIDMAERKEINRKAREQRIMAEQIQIPANAPKDAIDEAALLQSLNEAGKHNADLEKRRASREGAKVEIAEGEKRAAELRRRADELIAEAQRKADEYLARASEMDAVTSELRGRLETAPELPEPINTDALYSQIEGARQTNAIVKQAKAKNDMEHQAAHLEEQSRRLTERMDAREAAKVQAIAASKLPIESISLGDGVVLLNGVPFDQASDAEQLKASCALAMAGNPQLRVIRVRDGSLLDEDSLKLLAEMAEERDYQVWIERVGSGNVGFVLEDGHLKDLEKSEPELPGVRG